MEFPTHVYIENKSLRECRFYWYYLTKQNISLPAEPSEPTEYCRKINHVINNLSIKSDEKERAVEKMVRSTKESLLSNKELKPLDKGIERMCSWIWCYCRLMDSTASNWFNTPSINYNVSAESSVYLKYSLNLHPTTAEERYDLIIKFLDFSEADLDSKRGLLAFWQQAWGEVYEAETFHWLDNKNNIQCEWASNYLVNDTEYKVPNWFLPKPTTPQQMYDSTIAAFDIWNAHPDSKKLLIVKMKKAWSQKKHRDSMEGKKAYNFVLHTDAKTKLDAIAKDYGLKKNQCLEQLIEKEFALLKNK
ncbi:MAG: hypothetical protein V7736_09065 [Colwellia polaris]|jgi:hypothetical protein